MYKEFPKRIGLPPEIAEKVGALSSEADIDLDEKRYKKAAKKYIEAFRLLPSPKEQWEVAYHLIKFWGICYFEDGQYETAINSFESARFYKGADRDAELYLLLGKSYDLKGNQKEAVGHFRQALALGGKKVFAGKDKKYISII